MIKRILLSVFLFFIIFQVSAQTTKSVTNRISARVDSACIPDLGTGDGKDGAGNPASNILAGNYTLDAYGNFTSASNITLTITSTGNNVLNFNNFTLATGDTFSVNDIFTQGPLLIKCTGTAIVNGVISVSGKTGGVGQSVDFLYNHSAAGGTPGVAGPCGGVAGATGGAVVSNTANNGPNGTSYGPYAGGGIGGKRATSAGFGAGIGAAGGGGGSYGSVGTIGGNGTITNGGGAAGSTYDDINLDSIYNGTNLFGGSGGGGGGAAFTNNVDVDAGGGGGGGGGAVQLSAFSVDLTYGLIKATGGDGGAGSYGCGAGCPADGSPEGAAGGGGGGSGGTVVIQYVDSCTNCGTAPNIPGGSININGGNGGAGGHYSVNGGAGGNGGSGRFLLSQLCSLPTGVKENSSETILSVYPNPSSDAVNFVFSSEQNNAQIELYDVTGRVVKSFSFSGKQVTVMRESLPSGMYMYKCFSETNAVNSGKLIIM